ncbi:MAG: tyrosine-type recombinase/integrase [Dehalococcoidia bacterium]|nr:tyrosine-type recombinase/integrase [Dehalococcoidia bacterium]
MTALHVALDDYLRLRRSLGYKLDRPAQLLGDFVAFLDAAGAPTVTTQLALVWATQPVNAESRWRAARLGVVRGFARYLQTRVPETEVPSPGLLPGRSQRPAPYLYSDADLAALMTAARSVGLPLRGVTLEAVIGLLAATGLRVSEAVRLGRGDVDLTRGLLTVRNSKRGKSRSLPLHSSTVAALETYAARRDELCTHAQDTFFISRKGTRLDTGSLDAVFAIARRQAGLVWRAEQRAPRLSDLRHMFAVRTLLGWYQRGDAVGPRLPMLSTFLGHVSPASTYWYLSASPELLAAAATRLAPMLDVSS